MTLLQKMERNRSRDCENLRQEVRHGLWEALRQTLPNHRVIVFGSLVRPGRFNEQSDVDLALENEPVGMSVYQLCSLLAERLGRRLDVLLLSESRFRDKILKEGETWTLPG